MQAAIKTLDDTQLQTFDHDYVSDVAFSFICDQIDRDFRDANLSFLDVGGGKGLFTDRLLDRYRDANAVVLDNSDLLLRQNQLQERKRLVLASAADVSNVLRLHRLTSPSSISRCIIS